MEKNLVTGQITLTVGYDRESLTKPEIACQYHGEVTTDLYGRRIPKHAHGTANLERQTSSTRLITEAVLALYDRIVNDKLLTRRVTIAACAVADADAAAAARPPQQLDLFTDCDELALREAALEREKRMQQAMLSIKRKYGKNAILKGTNFEEGATTIQRNAQIGGHKA